MQDFMSEYRLKFGGSQLGYKVSVVQDATTVGGHRPYVARHELQAQAQSSEERLIKKQLRSRSCQLHPHIVAIHDLHATSAELTAGAK